MYDPKVSTPTPTQQRIAEAAADLLTDHGTAGTTHRAVAERLQLSLGTVTKYFPSALALRSAGLRVLSAEWDRQIADLNRILARATPERRPTAFADHLWAYFRDTRTIRSEAALTLHGIFDDDLRTLGLTWYHNFEAALAPYVTPTAAHALSTYLDGGLIRVATTGKPPTRTAVRTTINALWTI